jgi:hypothetical protein
MHVLTGREPSRSKRLASNSYPRNERGSQKAMNSSMPGKERRKTRRKGTRAGFSVETMVKISEKRTDRGSRRAGEIRYDTTPGRKGSQP